MKTILVPTDFSPEAEKAYALAASLAKAYNTDICVFNIVKSHIDDIVGHWNGTSLLNNTANVYALDEQEQFNAEQKLKELERRPEFQGITIKTKTSTSADSDPVSEVIEEINHKKYGVIIMGTAGDEQEGESFAEMVARHSVTPIITTKSKLDVFDPKNIVLCTDFESVNMGFLQRVRSLKDHFGSTLKLLYINTPKHFKSTKEIEQAAKRMVRKYGLGTYDLHVYNSFDVKEGIKEFIDREPSDMLALATHGRTGVLHYFYGSNTEDLINECEIPVYSYNLHEYLNRHVPTPLMTTRGFTG